MIYTEFEYAWPQQTQRGLIILPELLSSFRIFAAVLWRGHVSDQIRHKFMNLTDTRETEAGPLCYSHNYHLIQNMSCAFFRIILLIWDGSRRFIMWACFAFYTDPLFSLHESDRMWNVDWVEDSPWSGKEGEGGAGFQLWVKLGRKGSRSCLSALWDGSRSVDWTGGGSLRSPMGSFVSLITFTAAGAGPCRRTREGKTSPMMYTPKARCTWGQWGGSCEALRCGCPAWMNEFKNGNISQTSPGNKTEYQQTEGILCHKLDKRRFCSSTHVLISHNTFY